LKQKKRVLFLKIGFPKENSFVPFLFRDRLDIPSMIVQSTIMFLSKGDHDLPSKETLFSEGKPWLDPKDPTMTTG
jgi:hypothetical protein